MGDSCNKVPQGRHLFRLDEICLHRFQFLIRPGYFPIHSVQFGFHPLTLLNFLSQFFVGKYQLRIHCCKLLVHRGLLIIHTSQLLVCGNQFLRPLLHFVFQACVCLLQSLFRPFAFGDIFQSFQSAYETASGIFDHRCSKVHPGAFFPHLRKKVRCLVGLGNKF